MVQRELFLCLQFQEKRKAPFYSTVIIIYFRSEKHSFLSLPQPMKQNARERVEMLSVERHVIDKGKGTPVSNQHFKSEMASYLKEFQSYARDKFCYAHNIAMIPTHRLASFGEYV